MLVVFRPMNTYEYCSYLPIINKSYWSYLHQLSYHFRLGGPHGTIISRYNL